MEQKSQNIDVRERDRSHLDRYRYRKALVIALVFTFATLLILIYNSWSTYRYFQQTVLPESDLKELIGIIVHLDETLTMSARMAAATGEPQWEQRYQTFEPQLDTAIQKAKRAAPNIFIGETARQTDEANLVLIKMEKRAFELVHLGQRLAADTLLASREYLEQKQTYARGFQQMRTALHELDIAHLATMRRDLFLSFLFTGVTLPLLLLSWFMVLRMKREQDTEHKRAEEEMRFQGEIMKNMNEALYLVRMEDDVIVYTNSVFEKMFGYQLNELLGNHVSIINAPIKKKPEETAKEIKDILNEKGFWSGEVNNIRKDGTPFWSHANVSVFDHSKYGRVFVSIHTDITERKQMEEALQQSEDRFKEMFDDAPIGYHELDTEGRITLVNRTELMALCYSAEEMIGHYVWEFVDDKDFSRKAVLNKLAGTSSPGQNLERTYCMKDGTRIPVLIQDRLLRNKDGKITGIRTTVQDISERKRAEETLRESEAKYRILVQESPDAIAVYVGGKIVFANNASIRLMQATKEEELLGRSIIEFVHPDSREFVAKRMIEAQKEGKPLPLAEEKFIRLDGTALTAEVKAMPITFNLKPAIQLIIRDITERKRMEETARETANEREKLIKELQYALDNIKTLQGLIPICANCKKIRDDKGYWNQVEGYIMKHTGATFTHGCCPECMEKLYGYRNMKK